jgi:D-serine deaminase-like pyridoxal phosphate-dependent protein
MDLNSLATPSLLLDVDRVEQNASRIGNKAVQLGVRLRPHVKTHKCLEVARIQTAGHFGGVTVSTLAEAEAFVAGGFTDITYAVPPYPWNRGSSSVQSIWLDGVRISA